MTTTRTSLYCCRARLKVVPTYTTAVLQTAVVTGNTLGHGLEVHLSSPGFIVPESQVFSPQYYQPSQPDLLLPEAPDPTCSHWQKWLTGFEGGIFLTSPTPKVKKEKSPLQTRRNKSPPPTEHGVLRRGNLSMGGQFQGLSQYKVQDSRAMRRMLMPVQAACKRSLIICVCLELQSGLQHRP